MPPPLKLSFRQRVLDGENEQDGYLQGHTTESQASWLSQLTPGKKNHLGTKATEAMHVEESTGSSARSFMSFSTLSVAVLSVVEAEPSAATEAAQTERIKVSFGTLT